MNHKLRYLLLPLFLLSALTAGVALGQTNRSMVWSAARIDMLFPGGKTKALILSFDDGRTEDRRLVKVMNDHGLVGTFHLNSNKFGTDGYLTRAEIKELFRGHEVSVHSANHPNLPDQSKLDVVYEIVEDRRELERLVGYPVRGMAYPFGNTDAAVISAMNGLGIEYARTVADTDGYKIPSDFLRWDPTIHLFGRAFWKPNDAENDKRELERYYNVIDGFLKAESPAVLDIWGHSWELGDESKWAELERTFKLLAHRTDTFYTTQIGLVDYINAFRGLKFSVEKNMVVNNSAIDVFIKIGDKNYKAAAGSTTVF